MKKIILSAVLVLLLPIMALGGEVVTNGKVSVQSVDGKKGIAGFDIFVDGKLLCPVRLSSQEGIVAKNVKKDGSILVFSDLSGQGVTFGKGSFVKVEVKANHPYPEISFRLELDKFDEGAWGSVFGNSPFHFLIMKQENAEALHHRGWLVATPVLDPYPLKVGRQGIVCSKWSREWMWAPPFGACPIPVAALWSPKEKKYVGLDFTHARLTDHSDKYIASSYCWTSGPDKNFVTLVYPHAKGYVNAVRYPNNGDMIASHCELIYNLELPYWKDPNTFYFDYIWSRYKDLLPAGPVLNDLSYIPGDSQIRAFPMPGGVGLTYKVPANDGWESMFMEEGTIVPVGDVWTLPSIDYLYLMAGGKTDNAQITGIKNQLSYMESKAKKFKVEGDDCVFWEKPLEGPPKIKYAGDVTTLREVHGWSTAQTFLDVYRNEKNSMSEEQKKAYLEIIDGALNWTKYNICTRNDISDVPEAMFLIGQPGVSFCLSYYYTFRDTPERKKNAELAYEMARSLMLRYLTIFIADTDEEDNIEGTFLIEPNSGQPWTGAACANECCLIPTEMIDVYVATGDPLLKYFVQGMLERWSLMYQPILYPSIKKSKGKFTECYGLFDDCAIGGRGKRALYGSFSSYNQVAYPPGAAKARIVCGEKAAIVFNKDGVHTDISEYRSAKNGENFSFRVNSTLKEPFEIAVSYQWPYPNLMEKDIFIKRKGEIKKLSLEGDNPDYKKPAKRSFWCLQIFKVQDGDVIAVGKLDEKLPVLKSESIKTLTLNPKNYENEGFKIIDLAKTCNEAPSLNWDDNASYAPYFPGEHYCFKVPYYLVPAALNNGKICVSSGEIPVNLSVPYLCFFISEVKDSSKLTINYDDGSKEPVSFKGSYLAWQGWPSLFQCRTDMVAHKCGAKAVKSVTVENMWVWAVTVATPASGAAKVEWALQKISGIQKAEAEEKERDRKRQESLKTGFALCLKSDYAEAKSYEFTYMVVTDEEQEIPANSFLEYDIHISKDSSGINGGCELTGGTVGNIRDKVGGTHPGQKIDESKKGQWVHRKNDLTDVAGQTFQYTTIAVDGNDHKAGTYIAYYKNIYITDGKDKIFLKLYNNENAIPCGEASVAPNGGVKLMTNFLVEVVPAANVK